MPRSALQQLDAESLRSALVTARLQHARRKLLAARATSMAAVWQPLPHQIPPDPDADPSGIPWLHWMLMAGRGAGKTDAGAHYVNTYAEEHPASRIGIIAPTLSDARTICVEGETGLLHANPAIRFNRSWGELTWSNGARGQLFGAYTPEDTQRLRGPQHHLVWCEELASWRQLDPTWDMMRFGLRLGERPHAIITTTPRPRDRLKRLLADPRTVLSRATTDDNPYLHADVRAELYARYAGTRLGRQELFAELVEDIEGAYWHYGMIERARVVQAPQTLARVVVAVDPAGTHTDTSDYTGLCVAARGEDGHFYVLDIRQLRLSPEGWARRALDLLDEYAADRILAERNNGGDMVEATIRSVRRDAPIRTIVASRGKAVRAEPVAALYEQGRVHHVGIFAEAEEQMCSFPVQVEHDDMVDALVYAITDLMVKMTIEVF